MRAVYDTDHFNKASRGVISCVTFYCGVQFDFDSRPSVDKDLERPVFHHSYNG